MISIKSKRKEKITIRSHFSCFAYSFFSPQLHSSFCLFTVHWLQHKRVWHAAKTNRKKNYYRRHRHDSMQISIIVPVIVSCPTARNAVSKLIHVIEFLFLQVSCNRPFSICMQSLFSFADPHKLNVFKSKSKKNQFHLINGSYVWRGESWDFFFIYFDQLLFFALHSWTNGV